MLQCFRKENEQAINELKEGVLKKYSYSYKVTNWDDLFDEYSLPLQSAQTPQKFAEIAAKMLANANDIHITIEVDGERYPTYKRRVLCNYNLQLLPNLIDNWIQYNEAIASGTLSNEKICYLLITTWNDEKKEGINAAFQVLQKLKAFTALIIDVRPNGGGAEELARSVAGCFIEKDVVYAKHRIINPDSSFSDYKREITPTGTGSHFKGPIAVLTGQNNMSSCESFILMMKQVINCTIIGNTTYGSSGNPKPLRLSNNLIVNLPSWQAMDRNGDIIEGKGIKPDIEVKFNKEDFNNNDPVLSKAISFLSR